MTVEREAEMDAMRTTTSEQRARIRFLERRVWVSWVAKANGCLIA